MLLFLYISISLLALCPSSKAEVLQKVSEGEECLVMGNMIGQCKSGLTCETDKTSPIGLGYCRGGGVTYSLITSDGKNGYCNHADAFGEDADKVFPSTCHSSISSVESCKSNCTSQSSCIGYTYHIGPNPELPTWRSACHLYTSDSTCPIGFKFYERKYTAEIKEDLVVYPNLKANSPHEWVCFTKNAENSGCTADNDWDPACMAIDQKLPVCRNGVCSSQYCSFIFTIV